MAHKLPQPRVYNPIEKDLGELALRRRGWGHNGFSFVCDSGAGTQLIGLREKLQEKNIFHRKVYGFL